MVRSHFLSWCDIKKLICGLVDFKGHFQNLMASKPYIFSDCSFSVNLFDGILISSNGFFYVVILLLVLIVDSL